MDAFLLCDTASRSSSIPHSVFPEPAHICPHYVSSLPRFAITLLAVRAPQCTCSPKFMRVRKCQLPRCLVLLVDVPRVGMRTQTHDRTRGDAYADT